MKDAHYLFAEWLTLMARWLAAGADRERIAARLKSERESGRVASAKQTVAELGEAERRMAMLETKLKVIQAARDELAHMAEGAVALPVHL